MKVHGRVIDCITRERLEGVEVDICIQGKEDWSCETSTDKNGIFEGNDELNEYLENTLVVKVKNPGYEPQERTCTVRKNEYYFDIELKEILVELSLDVQDERGEPLDEVKVVLLRSGKEIAQCTSKKGKAKVNLGNENKNQKVTFVAERKGYAKSKGSFVAANTGPVKIVLQDAFIPLTFTFIDDDLRLKTGVKGAAGCGLEGVSISIQNQAAKFEARSNRAGQAMIKVPNKFNNRLIAYKAECPQYKTIIRQILIEKNADIQIKMQRPLQYAGFWKRYLADLIDLVLVGALISLLTFLPFTENPLFLPSAALLLLLLYPVWGECSIKQASLGKRILGIAVTDFKGKRISLVKAIKRLVVKNLAFVTLTCAILFFIHHLNPWGGKYANPIFLFLSVLMALAFILSPSWFGEPPPHDKLSNCLVVHKKIR